MKIIRIFALPYLRRSTFPVMFHFPLEIPIYSMYIEIANTSTIYVKGGPLRQAAQVLPHHQKGPVPVGGEEAGVDHLHREGQRRHRRRHPRPGAGVNAAEGGWWND